MKQAGITTISWGSNHLDIFGLGTDNQMYHKAWDGSAWLPSPTDWEPLGGVFNSAPAAVSRGSNRIDIFVLGSANQMYHKTWDGSAWLPSPTDWEPLGGVFNSPPAIASWGNNRLDIFALGTDNQMYHKAWDGSNWLPSPTGWDALGGVFSSPPAVASWGNNRLDIFALGTDNQMYHKAWDGSNWLPSPTGWDALGGVFDSPPAVVSWGNNRLDIFALGTDNQMYHKAWDGSNWLPSPTSWDALGGVFDSPPAVASRGNNRLDIFGLGTDDQMYHKAWDGSAWLPSPTGWEPLGGVFNSAPAAVSWGNNRLDIFGLGTDNRMYHKAWDGSAWLPSSTNWEPLGGVFNIPDWRALALIGKSCDCGGCCQPLCPPNPTVTCQVVSVTQGMNPSYIANGRKGDLVLCPADGAGPVGGLLGALDPSQVYSHMGIMVADKFLVRHCTASEDRLKAYPNGYLFGLHDFPAPVNGFEPDKVKYGWPGTITQSVDEAWHATSPENFPSNYAFPSAQYSDGPNASDPTWTISALSFDPVYSQDGVRRPALIVSPCQGAEMAQPELRPMLHRVADEAMAIRGHYRYYSYIDSTISLDPAYLGPPMPLYDSSGKQREGMMPDPSDSCRQIPTDHTVPMCCSSFIWTAVQRLKAKGIPITLDYDVNETGEPALPKGCIQTITPQWSGDVPDPKNLTQDGLYYYNVAQLHLAGQALNQYLHDDVTNAIGLQADTLRAAINKAFGSSLSSLDFGALLTAVGSALLGTVGTLLGITVADAANVAAFLTDMPDHVANQLCNSFANDNRLGDETSTAWKNPSEGRAVSPNNIVWFWDPTTFIGPPGSPAPVFQGLYGQNRELIPHPAMWGDQPTCQWQLSPGLAPLHGQVSLEGSSGGVEGALITCACRQTWSNVDGYNMEVPAGSYWATATWQDPNTDMLWSAAERVDIPWPVGAPHDFILKPPPVDWRAVEISGYAHMTDGQADGSAIVKDTVFNFTARMGPFGNPAGVKDKSGAVVPDTSGTIIVKTFTADVGGENTLVCVVTLNWLAGGIITSLVNVALKTGDKLDAIATDPTFFMNPGDVHKYSCALTTNEPKPYASDYADLYLTIKNKQQLG
jgi:hypothetical protein